MAEPIDILLYGLGAIGSFYAFILNRAPNVRLTVVARSNYDAVVLNGIKITSINHGEHIFRPFKVIKTPADAPGPFSFVVCTHKAIALAASATSLAPAVTPSTTIVILQNGVGNEEPFRAAFPACTIITGVVWVGGSQPSPGIVFHTAAEHTEIGLFANPKIDACLERQRIGEFVGLLRGGGTNVSVGEDMQLLRWKKVVWNAAWNSLTTLTNTNTKTWLSSSPEAVALSRRVMREMIEVGRECGVPLKAGLVDELMVKIKAMPGLETSMMVDCRSRRQLEIEVILGWPVRKGRELGVRIPTLEVLYAMLKGIDYAIENGEK